MICWKAGVWLFFNVIQPIVIFLLFILVSVLYTLLSLLSLFFPFRAIDFFFLDPDCPTPTRGTILIENEDQNIVPYAET